MVRTRKVALAATLLISAVLAGCSSDEPAADTSTTSTSSAEASTTSAAPGLEGDITVSAAASLTEVFGAIGEDFSEANPDVEVTFTFDSSSTLASQIIEGAPVDLFASADEANMTKLTDQDLIAGEPEVFARNELVIVTKPGNPEGITGLADLADAGIISLCGADVPCGKFAQQALDAAGVTIPESSVTRGQNVKATLTAVAEGDAVAGIVYVTDGTAAGDTVDTVAIPADVNAIATYPIGVVAASGSPDVAEAFIEWVLGEEGQATLEEYGFLPPE